MSGTNDTARIDTRAVNRRDTLRLLAAGGIGAAGYRAGILGARAAEDGLTVLSVGSIEVMVLSDGTLELPLSFALPQTPAAEVEALYQAHGLSFRQLDGQVNVTCIRMPNATILVDSGGGTDFRPTMGRLPEAMERAGLAAESITHVVFTHAHPDHLWGIIDPFEEMTRFPNARHLIAAAERDYWMAADIETRVPSSMQGAAIGSKRRLGIIGERLEIVAPGTEIVPGVSVVETSGHTPGHISILVRSGTDQLLIGGDAISNPIVSFAKPDWKWGPDIDSDRGAATRKRLLDMLATDRIRLLGYHLPWPGHGYVEIKDLAYRFVQTNER
jgi:glyoxylase-like metal-dependent hydrolase (beta-lactamase superfamily II)